jgi:hypothetical protein
MTTHRVIPSATIVVPESEVELYEELTGREDLVPIPDEYEGGAAVSNWCLDHFEDECLILMDDDISGCFSIGAGYDRGRWLTRDEILHVLEVTTVCAYDVGVTLFGFNEAFDRRKFQDTDPFKLSGRCGGGVMGVIGREYRLDDMLRTRYSVDFALQHLLKDRIVWVERRYLFAQKQETNAGGDTLFRSTARVARDEARVKEKWGRFVSMRMGKGIYQTKINVPRRQPGG